MSQPPRRGRADAVPPARERRPRSARGARARSPRAAAGRRCPRRETPPGASGSACRRGRPHRRGARVLGAEDGCDLRERRLGGAVAAPALVGLDGRVGRDVEDARPVGEPRERELHERERREHVDLVDAREAPRAGTRPAQAAGSGRATLALFTSRSIGSPAASTRRRRCSGSATSPATATTPSRPPTARCKASPSRASTTIRQPRSARARVSASPRPRDAPVTMACTTQAASTGTPWRATIRS